MNIKALCAAPPEALAHSQNQISTELPILRPHLSISPAAQRQRLRLWWRGEEGACCPGPEGQVLRHVLYVPVPHVAPKGSVRGGTRVVGVGSAAGR